MSLRKNPRHRILMIAPQPFYSDRGTPMNIRLMCRVLTEAGLRVDLAAFPTGRPIRMDHLTLFRPPRLPFLGPIPIGASKAKLVYDALLAVVALVLAATRRYSAVHGIEEGAVIAAVVGRIMNIPVICDMDSNLPEQLAESRFFRYPLLQNAVVRAYAWATARATLIVTVCRALSEQARRMAPAVPVVQIEDIPLSEHGSAPAPDALTPSRLRRRHGIEASRAVLYTGNLQTYQGIDLLLAAWEWLRRQSPAAEVTLVVVGGDAAEIDHYRARCRELGIAGSVRWIGQRPASEMDAWMELADLLVSPRTLGDNTPLKLFSYMASGRPVVATRRPTHTQVVGEQDAFLAEPEAADFGRAMLTALTDHAEAERRARAAREKIRRRHTYAAFRDRLLRAYDWVLACETPKPSPPVEELTDHA